MDPSLFQTGPFLGVFSDYVELARDYSQKKPIYTYYIMLYVYNSRNSIPQSAQKDSYMNILYNYLNAQASLYTPDNLKKFYNVCMRMKKDMNERYDLEGPSPDLCEILKSLANQLTVIQAFYPDKNLSGEIAKLKERGNALQQPQFGMANSLQPSQQQPQFAIPNNQPPPQQPQFGMNNSLQPPQQQPQFGMANSLQPSQQQPQFAIPNNQPPPQQPQFGMNNSLQPPQQQPQFGMNNSLQPPQQQQFQIPNNQQQPAYLSQPPTQPSYSLPVNNNTVAMPLPISMINKGNGPLPQISDISNPSSPITVPHTLPQNDGSQPLSYDLLQYIDCFNSNIRSVVDAHLRAAIYFDITKDQHPDEFKKYVNCSVLSYKYLTDLFAPHLNTDNRNNIKTLISSIYYPSLKRITLLEAYK